MALRDLFRNFFSGRGASDEAAAYIARAWELRAAGQIEAERTALEAALHLNPDNADVLRGLGEVFWATGRLPQARAIYERLVALMPDASEERFHLANILFRLGETQAALARYREAIAQKPEILARRDLLSASHYGDTLGSIVLDKRALCDWTDFDREERDMLDAVRHGAAHFWPGHVAFIASTPADQLACATARSAALSLLHNPSFEPPPRTARARLRLGYISGDFHLHPTAVLIAELFELHDRSRFEVVGYSIGPDDGSTMRQRLVGAFDRFVDLRGASHSHIAARINQDGIDILVDLKGWMRPSVLGVMALRPAPLQVTYLGFPGTVGVDFIDYVIADPFVLPPDHRPYFSEKAVLLPDCYQANDRKRPIASVPLSRAAHGLPERGFVFCAFHATFKITPTFFDIWMRLLKAVPESVLWLLDRAGKGADPAAVAHTRENLRQAAAARAVDPGRLIFAPRAPLDEHLARHALADLFLDTAPVNAHTTMSDALWAGLPALTCTGPAFVGRVGGSLLRAVGLPELATTTPADYEALALSLATTPDKLACLRQRLAGDRTALPLFDTPRFTRHLETAYRHMWTLYCSGAAPEAFAVAATGEVTRA